MDNESPYLPRDLKTAHLALDNVCYEKLNKHYKENSPAHRWAISKSKKIGLASANIFMLQFIEAWKQTEVYKMLDLEYQALYTDFAEITPNNSAGWIKNSQVLGSANPALAVNGFQLLFWFMPDQAMKLTETVEGGRLLRNLGDVTVVIKAMGVNKRWAFLNNCIKYGWKKAWAKAFPKTNPAIRNEVRDGRSGVTSLLRKGCKGLIQATEAISVQAYEQWLSSEVNNAREPAPQHGPFSLCYMRKENYIRECKRKNVTVNGVVYAPHTVFANYLRELNLPNPWGYQPTDWVSVEMAVQRHDQLVQWQAENRAALRAQRNHSYLQEMERAPVEHKKNWEGMNIPSNWKLLINRVDFDAEGNKMHHCIAGYFTRVDSMYAHIEYMGEVATLEWSVGLKKIIQLYSYNNSSVSDAFHKYVEGVMYQKK
jgi:hypothetical protein